MAIRLDYSYCLNEDTCIHRRGCRHWLYNYSLKEVKEICKTDRLIPYINEEECFNDDEEKWTEVDEAGSPFGMPFIHLDRFSDGNEQERGKQDGTK